MAARRCYFSGNSPPSLTLPTTPRPFPVSPPQLTDWGDYGHLQPLPVSYPGLATAAGLSWNAATQSSAAFGAALGSRKAPGSAAQDWEGAWGEADLASVLNVHLLGDPNGCIGDVLCNLGNTYMHLAASRQQFNSSFLFHLLIFPGPSPTAWKALNSAGLRSAHRHIKEQLRMLDQRESQGQLSSELQLVVDDTRLVADMMVGACLIGQAMVKADGGISSLPTTVRTDIANRLLPLLNRVEEVRIPRGSGVMATALAALTAPTMSSLFSLFKPSFFACLRPACPTFSLPLFPGRRSLRDLVLLAQRSPPCVRPDSCGSVATVPVACRCRSVASTAPSTCY